MPYITTERVKEIREALKKKFPNVKFSVTREHMSTVKVAIMESPYSWSSNYQQLNPFYPEREENPEFIKQIVEIISKGCETESVDGDYGNIPTFYYDVNVGKWDKHHVRKVK